MLWVVVLVGVAVLLLRIAYASKQPRPWTARKGECPFCGNKLLGATREYQRLLLLETLRPEHQYLCISCDREKVTGLLSTLGEGR